MDRSQGDLFLQSNILKFKILGGLVQPTGGISAAESRELKLVVLFGRITREDELATGTGRTVVPLPSDNGLVQLWCPINTPLHSLTVCSLSDDANGFNNFKNVHITPIQIKKPPNAFDNIVDKLNVRKKIPDYRCMEWMEDNRISVGIGRAVHIFNTEQEIFFLSF
uniref:uncharacterized protein LOC122601498 n=1 Tax=Erigeron canadensis TaxID=72917 RepID=UPI001CB916AA|nr:uncharacterized protein LOC122601498 [Erigeron canadensis]